MTCGCVLSRDQILFKTNKLVTGQTEEVPVCPEHQSLIDFIQEHHGTTLMSYFYSKALEQGGGQELMD